MSASERKTSPRAVWWLLATVLVVELMDLLDSTIVNVAGPSLERSLGTSPVGLQWVIGGYALALGAGLVLGGRLGDRFGRRPMFLFGLVAFTAASVLCAIAPDVALLITFRLVQGVAGAMMLPQGLGILRDNLSPRDLTKALAVFGPVLGLGGVLGPVLGGALVDWDLFGLGWRLVFLVNVPVGLAALALAWRLVPRGAGTPGLRVDIVGAALVAAASALLVLPLNEGQASGWPVWTWLSLTAAALGYVVFALWQRRIVRLRRAPLVTPALFGKPAFTVGLVAVALFFGGLIGTQLVLTFFLQIGQGFTAGAAGLGNLPVALGTAVGGGISGGLLAARLGRAVLQVGAVVQFAGVAWLWITLSGTDPFSIWRIVPGGVVAGIGAGIVIAAVFNTVLGAVADDEVGSASGVLTAVQSIGGSVGVAVFSTVFFADAARPTESFRDALVVQAIVIGLFLLISPLFPRRARPDETQLAATAAPSKSPSPAASAEHRATS
ncbi:MFS transporter [Kibdelosporangium phytohabitans]|uniref:MFS transporter permease n=1 Tax=Kibdelosporangium phytohabitans TaxID=860235 RepID=A0A0N9HRM1_9PSEU|nr:MFS transporter [Kibdelosporangium phytohabitans]ALG09845.1 MFS transporter permease [Kibdelosporangium phytohabitans]MBE1468765.1 EmrB/QacA subfamily drug resistance transporter [Kibdelosporangium phytohabitans]